ncbi:RND family efflux transporter MFP subunit [Anseongella ginsenosidimutans]|uniref:RND family efflux transporter MFP subunit n=1 Tax=Anseongella ginsenosidimutans TaxID=496056 RepID=A0A4R3KP32_9SPHI|nr:efflux RND transporter periplasmic adaptor subunit [Anseongella ginsenosidimutans]QEC53941.1 HlyD family efflux transporter periplasmic adaptor subunit [Anseongella ginsenosidimutans]TCS86328.1 RND family efflux transporter MFP subunit [Anseongella ginsenosidimutans]
MKKNTLIVLAVAVILLITLAFVFSRSGPEGNYLTYTVKKGNFRDEIVTTGELAALRSERIRGPMGLQRLGIYDIKIQSLVPEGTRVKKGDVVGTLDQSALEQAFQQATTDIQAAESRFIQNRLDTTLTLRGVRDELRNTLFSLEQAKITLEQSKFEPPATIRQETLNVEKIERSLVQLKEKYKIQQQQAEAKMVEASAQLQRVQNRLDEINKIREEFTVKAPGNGIVTYVREWNGSKIEAGSQISPWNPDVAQLPDLSEMLSRTFVSEIDVRKIKVGQQVAIGLDAFPNIKLSGKVTEVANIGDKKQGSDAKIFPVTVAISKPDSALLPGMTTINTILIDEVKEVVTVPLEAVFTENDKRFVYLNAGSGILKQEVELGKSNQNFVIVKKGLEAEDVVLLNEPDEAKAEKIHLLADAK